MPRRRHGTRTRSDWILAEKGPDRQHYSTRGELARTLGIRVDRLKEWERAGKVPPPDAVSEHGWKLWSPETVGRIIRWRTNRGERR